MNVLKYKEVIHACRFCFMCRHLDTVGNVTFQEADTPRGRALILDKVRMDKENLKNPDFIDTIYKCALSASCRRHCVSSYDEAGLVLAARQDIVAAGFVPEKIKILAEELEKVEFKVEGQGDLLYYVDPYNKNPEAFVSLVGKCKKIKGGDTGKALEVLGFAAEAKAVFAGFNAAIKASGCKKIVTSCPASYDMMKKNLKGAEVLHSSEHLLAAGFKSVLTAKACYLESDFLKNYNDNMAAPRELLKSLGFELIPFGTNPEESYAVGEGGVIFDKINPELCERLCRRVYDLTDNPPKDVLITASPYTKSVLKKYQPKLTVLSLEEAVLRAKGK
jgi:Fe-S oxidoreductase